MATGKRYEAALKKCKNVNVATDDPPENEGWRMIGTFRRNNSFEKRVEAVRVMAGEVKHLWLKLSSKAGGFRIYVKD